MDRAVEGGPTGLEVVGHVRAGQPLLDRDAASLDNVNLVDSRDRELEGLAGQRVVEDPIPLQGRLRLAEPNLRDVIVVDLVHDSLHPLTQQARVRAAGPAVQDPSRFGVGGAVHWAVFLQSCVLSADFNPSARDQLHLKPFNPRILLPKGRSDESNRPIEPDRVAVSLRGDRMGRKLGLHPPDECGPDTTPPPRRISREVEQSCLPASVEVADHSDRYPPTVCDSHFSKPGLVSLDGLRQTCWSSIADRERQQ